MKKNKHANSFEILKLLIEAQVTARISEETIDKFDDHAVCSSVLAEEQQEVRRAYLAKFNEIRKKVLKNASDYLYIEVVQPMLAATSGNWEDTIQKVIDKVSHETVFVFETMK